jgi:hypothetical protein
MFDLNILERLRRWKDGAVAWFTSLPGWVIVLVTAAVVGSISAVVAVIGLSRWRNRSASLPEPVEIDVQEQPVA